MTGCFVMGVVNVTPDSFSDGGRFADADAAIAHGLALRALGADILDVGGESTRPGAERVTPAREQQRVLPVVQALAEAGIVVSIDTMNATTAAMAVAAGARIVNDVSGGLADPDMLPAVAASGADVVLQHWRGHSADMYARASYGDIVREVTEELRGRMAAAASAGIAPSRVILDPGIGFGKKGDQNWAVLRALPHFVSLGSRLLVGTSRKRFLTDALRGEDRGDPGLTAAAATAAATATATATVAPEPDLARRDGATAVTSVLAARAGAWGVRVHDVQATRDALQIAHAWENA